MCLCSLIRTFVVCLQLIWFLAKSEDLDQTARMDALTRISCFAYALSSFFYLARSIVNCVIIKSHVDFSHLKIMNEPVYFTASCSFQKVHRNAVK